MTAYAAISEEHVASIISNYPDDAGSVYFEMPVFFTRLYSVTFQWTVIFTHRHKILQYQMLTDFIS
jgi:hypothetical protein